MTEIRLQSCHVETYMTPFLFPSVLSMSQNIRHARCTERAQELINCRMILTVCPFSLSTSLYSLCSPTSTAFFDENKHLSSLIVFPLSFVLCILSSLPATFPLALSSYLRLTAPVRASLTSWCLQVCQPSPLNQRRSTLFLPRGSAPSVHALTAWLTATRSET